MRLELRHLVLTSAGFVLAGTIAHAQGTISGRVVDALTGDAIEHAVIVITGSGTMAAVRHDGTFSVEPPTTLSACTLDIAADGYEPARIDCSAVTASPGDRVALVPTSLRIHEGIVVTPARAPARTLDAAASLSVLSHGELARRLPRTAPEALMDVAGVLVQKTSHGGGSPYLRGLVGNHVLILVDGVRLNNATFRYGPNQYLATIDPGQIDRIEVLRGSGSVLYGSDAIGGVINIVTRRPVLPAAGIRAVGRVSARAVSGGMEQSGRAEAEVATPSVGVLAGVAVRNYGDLVAGGSLGVEAPSAYREINGDVTLIGRTTNTQRWELAYQHVHQDDVPRFDQVSQRGFARYAFDPQVRQLARFRFERQTSLALARTLRITAAWHRSLERRERQRADSPVLVAEKDVVDSLAFGTEIAAHPWSRVLVRYGVDLSRDRVGSARADTDTLTGARVARRGLYPDGAHASSMAGFVAGSFDAGATLVEAGVRASRYAVRADDAVFGTIDLSPAAVVGQAALSHAFAGSFRAFASVSQAFRAPNVDDVSTLGPFDFGIEVPSPTLTPERAVSWEAGLKFRGGRASLALSAYRTNLDALVDRVRAEFLGQEVLEGQRVYRRANVGRAYVRGVEVQGEWRLRSDTTLFGHATHTFGQQVTSAQPMRRIPPFNGLLGTRWSGPRGIEIDGTWRFAARQDRLSSGDRDDYRIDPDGTPSWNVLGLLIRYPIREGIDIVGAAENLLDDAYRVHGSGIDGAGRHVWLGVRMGS